MPQQAQSFEDHYRTRDGQALFRFRFDCDAGSSSWRFKVKYGDTSMTHSPDSFHDSGLVLLAATREELLNKAACWVECIHRFHTEVNSTPETIALEQVDGSH